MSDESLVTIGEAIAALDNIETVQRLCEKATEHNCKLSLCFPREQRMQDEIHFIVEEIDPTNIITFNDTAALGVLLRNHTDYECIHFFIKALYKQATLDDRYVEIIPFNVENFVNIGNFVRAHYQVRYLQEEDKGTSANPRDSSSSSTFWSSENQVISAKSKSIIVERLVDCVRKDKELWESLKRSPEVLDEFPAYAKRVLLEEASQEKRPT